MNVAIFAGPTIDVAAVTAAIDAVVLPPVRQGDVYRLVEAHAPRMIGIVDGYFHQVPSVWHKEILWALSRGVAVFGSASMGALRAAELASFGMVGVGVVYEAYRDGRFAPYNDAFEHDDEVAVMHGPAELGYPAVSEALVNIRTTLDRAERESVIDPGQRDALKDLARSMYYADRTWESLLQAAQTFGLACPYDRLSSWLAGGRVNRKRLDAEAMIAAMKSATESMPQKPRFHFEHTGQWQRMIEGIHARTEAANPALVELALRGDDYIVCRRRAVRRLLALDSPGRDDDALADIRAVLELAHPERSARQLNDIHRDPDRVDDLLGRELAARTLESWVRGIPADVIERHMAAELRDDGRLEELQRRAAQKREVLDTLGNPLAAAALRGPEDLQLLDWYFGRRLGAELPDDLGEHARTHGFTDAEALIQAVFDEYLFTSKQDDTGARTAGDAV